MVAASFASARLCAPLDKRAVRIGASRAQREGLPLLGERAGGEGCHVWEWVFGVFVFRMAFLSKRPREYR